ncbi:hypothetical protein Tco_1209768 [Tanacetum coccineum]
MEEVEETLGALIEVEPLDHTKLEDVGLGEERGSEPPIKPHSPDSFRMKVIDPLTIHTPPSPHVASFHLKDVYCYYHPCIDDPKKHYEFKTCLLGESGYLGVDFSNLKMIEDDWELESKEVSFLDEESPDFIGFLLERFLDDDLASSYRFFSDIEQTKGVLVEKRICLRTSETQVYEYLTMLDLRRNWTKTQHLVSQSVETTLGFATTPSEVKGDDVTTTCDAVMITDIKKPLEDSAG